MSITRVTESADFNKLRCCKKMAINENTERRMEEQGTLRQMLWGVPWGTHRRILGGIPWGMLQRMPSGF